MPISAWGGCWVCAAEIGLGWWVCIGFVDSVGLGLCGGGLGLCGGGFGSLPRPGVVDSVVGWVFGSLPRPGVVESVAWGGCWVTGSGARPEGGGAVSFGG